MSSDNKLILFVLIFPSKVDRTSPRLERIITSDVPCSISQPEFYSRPHHNQF